MWDPNDTHITETIHPSDLQLSHVLGKGGFGQVRKGVWRGRHVVVKQTEKSKEKYFTNEWTKLSRVSHQNIVKLLATDKSFLWLVMEFAEGGSLWTVLHFSEPRVPYSPLQALSWLYQCASGVAYLHSIRPKPIIHRDLKSPNLLLFNERTLLKICDFGTARDMSTFMTNNQGTPSWMAPEVFRGNEYDEKCDVFSWAIILWEVLSRKIPFGWINDIVCIQWAIHNNARPPLLANCPNIIENLMTKCWANDKVARPSMSAILGIMDQVFDYVYDIYHGNNQGDFEFMLPLTCLSDAQMAAKKFSAKPYPSPGVWEPVIGDNIPVNDTVVGGYEANGEAIYVGRVIHDQDTLPGKVIRSHGVCYVSCSGEEYRYQRYQVLTNPHHCELVWIYEAGGKVPNGALVGGQDMVGENMYIGRANHNGSLVIGKVHPSHRCLYIPYGGYEIKYSDYEVLVCKYVCFS